MWRLLSLSLLLIFSPAFADSDVAWKTIELEWEEVPHASSYEVKLTPAEQGAKIHVFTVPDNHLSQQVPIGKYKLQVRAKSKETDEFSPWSAPSDIEVVTKEVIPIHPADKDTISADGSAKQSIEFKWSPVENARIYTLKVWSEEKKDTPWVFTGSNTSRKLEVPPGRMYYWQVYFESADNVAYQQEPKIFTFTLQGTKLITPEVNAYAVGKNLSWKPGEEAKTFKVKLSYQHLDETAWTPVKDATLEKAEWDLGKLKPGRYQLEVMSMAPRRLNSDTAKKVFLVKPTAQELADR